MAAFFCSKNSQIWIFIGFSVQLQIAVSIFHQRQGIVCRLRRLVYLKDRLAKYELSVAQFYTKREAYVAVVNRVEGMMRDYPDTQATHDAIIPSTRLTTAT